MTLYDLFRGSVQDFPNNTAIICSGESLSYRELNAKVDALTAELLKWGIQKGERVGIYYPNCTFYPVLLYALLRVGAVFVPFNTRLNSAETVQLINSTDCATIIVDKRYEANAKGDKSSCGRVKRWICGDNEGIAPGPVQNAPTLAAGESVPVSGEDEGLIIFTGGTTGHGTGVLTTHGALVSRVVMKYRDDQRTLHSDVMLNHSPLFHTGGLSLMIQTLSAGGCFVMSEKFDPDAIIADCEKYKVTQMALIPPGIVYRIAQSPLMGREKLASVRLCIVAGGPADEDMVEKIFDTFPNTVIYLNYGSSENSITLGHVMSREDYREKPWRIKSVGIANMASFVRLLDEAGNEVPEGEPGEAWGRSAAQMKRYLGKEDKSVNGWIPTGDIFKKDADGYFYFVCRKKNMIKTGGENVYAEEVETVLREHPAVRDCVVFGQPDKGLGETVAAAVIAEPGALPDGAELTDFVRQHIASYKKPRRLYYLDSFPTTALGKLSRAELIESLSKRQPDYRI